MVQVTTRGQVQAGALTRVAMTGTGAPFALASVEVEAPDTGAAHLLVATDRGLFRIVPQGGIMQGVVVDPASRPVVGADVTLLGTPFHAVTDATGHFVLANLPLTLRLSRILLHVDGRLAVGGPFTEAFPRTIESPLKAVVLVPRASAVSSDPVEGGHVTFPEAPGAAVDLPAHAIQLPAGMAPRLSRTARPLRCPHG